MHAKKFLQNLLHSVGINPRAFGPPIIVNTPIRVVTTSRIQSRAFSVSLDDLHDSTDQAKTSRAAAQCGFFKTEYPICDDIPCLDSATCALLESPTYYPALTKLLLYELITLRKRFDASEKKVQEHNRMKFLGELSLWVRDTHLKNLVNVFVKHKLKAITGYGARKADSKAERTRTRNLLDYIPGVVDYLNAGNNMEAMWMEDEGLRTLAVQNYEIIAEVAKPFYNVSLILQQSVARNEQFHVAYPILRNRASTVESLGRFLQLAPSYFPALHPEDRYEVQRKLDALQNMYEQMRAEETEEATSELYDYAKQ